MGGDQFLEKLVQDGTQIPTIVMSSELDNENSARAVYYSHRMYTPKQIGILQLQQHIQPSVNEQITYTNQQMEKYRTDYIRARRERRVLNIKDYLGFTAIQKPIDENDILERIRIIQRRLYENNQQ